MKYSTVFLFFLSSLVVSAQVPCGIFTNKSDFDNKRPSIDLGCDGKMNVRNNRDIVIRKGGERVVFKSQFIYGYADGKNMYRSYAKGSVMPYYGYYKVLYNSGVIIYSKVVTDFRGNKRTYYYYSESMNSPILPIKAKYYERLRSGEVVINVAHLGMKAPLTTNILNLNFTEGI